MAYFVIAQVTRSSWSNNESKPKSIFKHYQRNTLLDAQSVGNKNPPPEMDSFEPLQKLVSEFSSPQEDYALAK